MSELVIGSRHTYRGAGCASGEGVYCESEHFLDTLNEDFNAISICQPFFPSIYRNVNPIEKGENVYISKMSVVWEMLLQPWDSICFVRGHSRAVLC